MATKKSSRISTAFKQKPLTKRQIVRFILVTFVAFVFLAISSYAIDRLVIEHNDQARLDRIYAIYSSLQLDSSYRSVKSDVFGDKRVYSWDAGRTYSSSAEFGHNDTVSNTFADLKKKIEAAGFTMFETAYDNSVAMQYHFKDAKNEYVRLSVETSKMHDMVVYGTPTSVADIGDTNAAPSYVTIKVNLDDNNE